MTAFDRALKQTLGFEGGLANSPIDRGGLTYRGITQHLYDAWRASKTRPKQSVTLITDAEIVAIAREEFWQACRCDDLPDPIAIAVFDMAFNSGPEDARKALQRALGVRPDGWFGPKTEAALAHEGPDLLLKFLKQRGAHIQNVIAADPPQVGNLEGWINRLLDQAYGGGT